jgi:hypothetical protein
VGEGGREGLRGVGCGEGKRNECGGVVVFEVRGGGKVDIYREVFRIDGMYGWRVVLV